MSTAFDSMFLPGGDGFGPQDDFLDFDASFNTTNFTPINTDVVAGNPGTVSPHDLLRDDSMVFSAPHSTAFPNLSTPESGYLESPALASSGLNTSPMEDGLLDSSLNFNELEMMTPLFPQNSHDQFAQDMSAQRFSVDNSFNPVNSRPSTSNSPMVRQKSSPGRPPSTSILHSRKLSLTSGIHKSNSKSRKALPEISIDSEDDKETAKRKKNTAAARKSRQRKQETQEALENEIQRLRGMVVSLGGNPDVEQ